MLGSVSHTTGPMTPTRWMARFAAARIELIAPHKLNRTRPRTQDGRPLSRYQRR
jgi:hypothetical protein